MPNQRRELAIKMRKHFEAAMKRDVDRLYSTSFPLTDKEAHHF